MCGIAGVVGKNKKLIVRGGGGRGGKKLKILIAGRGWLLNCFFLSFCNYENCSIKKIWADSKSKIKTSKNLDNFKMINRRLFIHKFGNNSRMLLSSSWAIFIRAPVFSSSPRANLTSFEYLLRFTVFRFY